MVRHVPVVRPDIRQRHLSDDSAPPPPSAHRAYSASAFVCDAGHVGLMLVRVRRAGRLVPACAVCEANRRWRAARALAEDTYQT